MIGTWRPLAGSAGQEGCRRCCLRRVRLIYVLLLLVVGSLLVVAAVRVESRGQIVCRGLLVLVLMPDWILLDLTAGQNVQKCDQRHQQPVHYAVPLSSRLQTPLGPHMVTGHNIFALNADRAEVGSNEVSSRVGSVS